MVGSKTCRLATFFLLAILFHFHPANACVTKDLQFIVNSNPILTPSSIKKNLFGPELWETSELKLLFLGSIRLYQLFISSQDLSVCNFTPSCSHFAQQAIRRYGLIRGILMASDRLQRCNGMSIYYPRDERTGKYKDPVENYSTKSHKIKSPERTNSLLSK